MRGVAGACVCVFADSMFNGVCLVSAEERAVTNITGAAAAADAAATDPLLEPAPPHHAIAYNNILGGSAQHWWICYRLIRSSF